MTRAAWVLHSQHQLQANPKRHALGSLSCDPGADKAPRGWHAPGLCVRAGSCRDRPRPGPPRLGFAVRKQEVPHREVGAGGAGYADPSASGADPLATLLSPAGQAVRVQACRAQADVRLGVLINGRADGGRMAAAWRELAGPWPLRVTSDISALRRALAELLAIEGVNVLALAGGDGTVHHACNVLFALQAEAERLGVDAPLPRLLLLRGGTMNILARATGHQVAPARSLARFARAFTGAPWSAVPARRLGTLAVTGAWGRRYGFVFGSEVVYHAIALYDGFGAGYGGLTRFLFELARGALVGSELWRRERWRLGPFGHALDVHGAAAAPIHLDAYTAAVATTTDLTLATGAIAAIRRAPHADGFHARVVGVVEPAELVAMVPALLAGREHRAVLDVPEAHRLDLWGPCTLDGELVDDPSVAGRGPVVVDAGPRLHVVPAALGIERW